MKRRTCHCGVIFFLFSLAAFTAGAQKRITIARIDEDSLASGSVTVHVTGPNHERIDKLTVVKLYLAGLPTPVMTSVTYDPAQVVLIDMRELGRYTVVVISKGYQTAQETLNYSNDTQRFTMDISLKPLDASGGPEQLPASAISSRAQKHMQKGLAELQFGDAKSGQKELEAAYAINPNIPDISYLLGIACARSNDMEHGRAYFQQALNSEPNNPQALIALGQLSDMDGDFAGAEEVLQKSISLDPNKWLAHLVLADVELREKNYEKARDEAKKAIRLGEGSASKAEFIEAEALEQLGLREDAMKRLESFLRDAPGDSAMHDAQGLLAKLRLAAAAESSAADGSHGEVQPVASATISLPPVGLLSSTWAPQDVDQVKPLVSSDVQCPAQKVIAGAGESVRQLVESVNNITASEKVVYEDLNPMGRPISVASRKYDYIVYIEDNERGLPIISESRDENSSVAGSPQKMSLFALLDLALIFHPQIRDDFQMTCEGLGKWKGEATWIVYFRQRLDRPSQIRSYESKNSYYTAGLKGRAWIAANSFQILRIESDLISPIPQLGLGSEEDAIEYGPVEFQSKKTQLWLPKTADIYFSYHHRPFRRQHSFSNYMLFSVGSTQKISAPQTVDNP